MIKNTRYAIMIGTSWLTSYKVIPGIDNEYIGSIREGNIMPYEFTDKNKAKEVAKHFGGTVITRKYVN